MLWPSRSSLCPNAMYSPTWSLTPSNRYDRYFQSIIHTLQAVDAVSTQRNIVVLRGCSFICATVERFAVDFLNKSLMHSKGALFDPLFDPRYSENSNIVK